MVCGVKTLIIIFIVAYYFHTVSAFDGCPKWFYGELYNKKKFLLSFQVDPYSGYPLFQLNSY